MGILRAILNFFGSADEWVVDTLEDHVIDSVQANDGNVYEKRGQVEKRVDFGSGNVSTEATGEVRVVQRE